MIFAGFLQEVFVGHIKLSSAFIAIVMMASVASATPVHLRCEYLENPLGIDKASPQLSWQSNNTERNWKQAAYEVLVAGSAEQLQAGDANVWDSGKIKSAE